MTAPTLTEFLLARIAEDEAVAREAEDGPWDDDDDINQGEIRNAYPHRGTVGWIGLDADRAHVIRHDPARVLAECEAKRRIVDAFEDERRRKDIYNRDYPLGLLTTDGDLRARLSSNARWAGLDVALRALVAVYADHPDYDEAWRA